VKNLGHHLNVPSAYISETSSQRNFMFVGELVRNGVKRKTAEDISSRPAKVIKNELFASNEENLKSSDITSLRQALYRERRK
jgi:hypothetical protein